MVQKIKFDMTTKVLSTIVMMIPVTLILTHRFIIKDDVIIPDIIGVLLLALFSIAWMLHPTSYGITSINKIEHRSYKS
jgi:riboflavin transporter FmnP